ncbi:ribosome silencing factor [Lentilactobacillus kribbianus]|uniref:ribosome silencing factor n=1 Tax=Lentilactobacillus kribbianus TaxID=2729622 RepID=UPI0015516771|nr:ribosome silencing factor [Lentilactobacillus kribbianus]
MDTKNIAKIAVQAADSKRGEDIVVLDMEPVSLMADYFVIIDANSNRQVKAIADEVSDQLAENNVEVYQVSGRDKADWILIDAGEVIIHVFQKETREFYNIEKLWSDAPMLNITDWVD